MTKKYIILLAVIVITWDNIKAVKVPIIMNDSYTGEKHKQYGLDVRAKHMKRQFTNIGEARAFLFGGFLRMGVYQKFDASLRPFAPSYVMDVCSDHEVYLSNWKVYVDGKLRWEQDEARVMLVPTVTKETK